MKELSTQSIQVYEEVICKPLLRDLIIIGFARALFVSAYAEYCEDHPEDESLSRAAFGSDWMDAAPATPADALVLAAKKIAEIEELNSRPDYDKETIEMLYIDAIKKIETELIVYPGRTYDHDPSPDLFGHYLAMEALGHGVSWADTFPDHGLKLPHCEYYIEY